MREQFRVVVTGVGLVSPVGVGTEASWAALQRGDSGIDRISLFDAGKYSCQFAGEVKGFAPENFVDRKDVKKMGRFIQFAMAAALIARKVGLAELTDGFVLRPEVQAIFPRVSFATTTETMDGSAFAPADAVEITTNTGETLKSGPVAYAKGSHQHPLSRDELWGKFADCLGAEFPDTKKSHAFENLMMLDRLNGSGDLVLQNH